MTSPYSSLAAAKAAFPNQSYVDLPAGDNSSVAGQKLAAKTTYFFEAGVHTLGGGEFSQIIPAKNDTFVGAPGAILDGQNQNAYAFTQQATGFGNAGRNILTSPGFQDVDFSIAKNTLIKERFNVQFRAEFRASLELMQAL